MKEVQLTDQNFEKEVLKSNQLVLVDFWAEWCGPCKTMLPIVEELAKEYEGKSVKIGKLNVDENPETAAKYNIMSIPTFNFFKGGEVVYQTSGAQPKEKLSEMIDKYLSQKD